jgi:DNA-binding HxlR family transcriptional regulator
MSGPKRFTDLQESLAGIGTNMLSVRLKEMEKSGIIMRRKLPPPGVALVYELTELGRGLDDTLISLVRWGIPLMAAPKGKNEHFKPHWLMFGMLSAFNQSLAEGLDDTYEFQVDEEIFHIRVKDGQATGNMGTAYEPDLIWVSNSKSFLDMVFRVITVDEGLKHGELRKGTKKLLKRVLDLFDPMLGHSSNRCTHDAVNV